MSDTIHEEMNNVEQWVKELTSSLSKEYENILEQAREKMFDIYSIVPHRSLPEIYVGVDALNNEIALIWFEDVEGDKEGVEKKNKSKKTIVVESLQISGLKRMN